MSEYDYEALCDEIAGMERWQIVALSAACAQKALPLVKHLATAPTRQLAEDCLKCMWRAAEEDADEHAEQASELRNTLMSSGEWQSEEDLDSLQCVVVQALNLFVWALECVSCDTPAESGERVGFSHMLTVAESFDVAASGHDFFEGARVQEREEASQLLLVQLVQTNERSNVSAAVRPEVLNASRLFASQLPVLCYDSMYDFVSE